MTTFGDQVFQFGGAPLATAGYPGDYVYTTNNPEGAKTYYVNNITGSSSNDGLSWKNALVTLAEVPARLPSRSFGAMITPISWGAVPRFRCRRDPGLLQFQLPP
jgi:hypothetical protein